MQVWSKSPEYLLLMFDSISLQLHLRHPFRIRVDILSFSPDNDNGPGDQLSQWRAGNRGTYQAVRVAFHNIVATALTLRLQIIESWRELHEKKNEHLSQGITPIVLPVLLKEDTVYVNSKQVSLKKNRSNDTCMKWLEKSRCWHVFLLSDNKGTHL